MLHEIEQHLQLGPTITPVAADLLGADHFAAGRLQGGLLKAEVLVEGDRLGWKPNFSPVSMPAVNYCDAAHTKERGHHVELTRFGGAWEAFPGEFTDAEDTPPIFT